MDWFRDFLSWLFAPAPASARSWQVLLEWEARRVFLNLALIPSYFFCVLLYDSYVENYSPDTEAGNESSALIPVIFSLVGLFLVVQFVYTIGYLIEIFARGKKGGAKVNRSLVIGLLLLNLLAMPVICCVDYKWTLEENRRNSS